MHLEDIKLHIKNLSQEYGSSYTLGDPATASDIATAEQRLRVKLPSQVAEFYTAYNGMEFHDPQMEILPLREIQHLKNHRLHFATIDGMQKILFDTSQLNIAQQWDIVSINGYRITLTMASFWSNKIWAWLQKRRKIWEPIPDVPDQ
jgi:cell wall assembly regulator SMI1